MSELQGGHSGRRKPKSAFTTRQHLGVCVVCRAGIFTGDETARGRGQWMGLCHAACLERVSK
jgi:hypothetical protein